LIRGRSWLGCSSQPAAAHVQPLLEQADKRPDFQLLMSWVNVGEVYYMASRKLGERHASAFLVRLPALPIRLVLPGQEAIIAAAKLKSTRRISYADGFAAALAIACSGALVTGDPELREMADILTVDWIGDPPPVAPPA